MPAPLDLAFWKVPEQLLFFGLVPMTDSWQLHKVPEYSLWTPKHHTRLPGVDLAGGHHYSSRVLMLVAVFLHQSVGESW